jgi:hypothetical protein
MQAEIAVEILQRCGYDINHPAASLWQLSFRRDQDGTPVWVDVREEDVLSLAEGLYAAHQPINSVPSS